MRAKTRAVHSCKVDAFFISPGRTAGSLHSHATVAVAHTQTATMTLSESLDNYFKITQRGSTINTELRAGLTSFLTLSYILLVHPQVLPHYPRLHACVVVPKHVARVAASTLVPQPCTAGANAYDTSPCGRSWQRRGWTRRMS